ncbi:melanoma inhibitory activity protein 2 isoform X1 [Anolis carolinensis]|uniref:melanoma inhibitory activity protein 2 isoform X1 n=1 Tax=Anolis carolinensis TaxID=28377 RepID=UPI002F2B8A46
MQDSELGKSKTPHRLSVKSKLKNRLSNGQCIQIHWNHTAERLEMQNNIDAKDKHLGHILEVEQAFPVELENVNSSPGISSSERSTLMKEEPNREEAVQQKNEYIKNYRLEETEMYLDRESKGEMGMDNEVEISLVTCENKFFREAKEHSDNFSQSGNIPGEDDILDVGDKNNVLLHGRNEPVLSEKSKVMGTEIRETIKKADSKSIDLNEHASTDQTNKKTQKEEASENMGQSSFSSHSSQDIDLSDITHSEEKHRQFEQPQPLFSLSHYRLLLNFQSFTDENMNSLQGVQDDKSTKDEDSQSKSIAEIWRKKETEENKQLYENMEQETSMNIYFSNKGILLTSSAEQDNGDTESIIKGAQSLTDTSASTETYLSGYTIDSLFRNQKLKERRTEDKECTNIKGKNQSLSSEEKDLVTDYSEKRELSVVKSIESMSPDAIKDDFPRCRNDYDDMNESVLAKESLDQFSQGDNNKNDISEHLTESDEGKQNGDEDAENKSNKPPSKEDSNMLNQQGLSIEATLQGEFENENEIEGLAGHTLSYDFMNVKQNPQDLQMQTDEKSSEEKYSPTTDNDQHSDSSLTAKVVYGHEPQEQETSYQSSGTWSKEMTLDLIYQKEDENEPKSEEVAASSYLALLDRDSSSFMGLEPDEKCINQVAYGTQIHLKAEKLKIPNQHKQIDNIPNNGGNKPDLEEKIIDIMPKLSKVTSEKKTVDILPIIDNEKLFQKHSVAENIASENPSLNLEMKSETLETDNNVEPSKLSPYDIPHHLEAVGFAKDHIPPLTKNSFNIHHLATDPDDETFEQDRITPLPKHLKWGEEPGYVKDSQGKDQKVIENYGETEHSGRIENTGRQGVVSNIFGKTSWFFGELFQNKPQENVIENESNGNLIATQAKVERQEADVVGSDFEEGKSEVQGTKASHYSHALKSIEQESQGKMHSLIMEKSVTKDERHYNQKYDIQETEFVSQETVQNDTWITDTKLDLKEDRFFTGFQETYIKLVAESKRILQANVCERHELQLLAQEFEKLYYEITNSSCEDVYSNKKQITISLKDEHKLKIMHERCLKTKMNLRLELQSLVLDIRNNCAIERATSGIINKEQLPGNAPKESDSHNEPNNSQDSEANNIPLVDTEEKMLTSIKNYQDHPDVEEKLPGDLRMTHNSFIRNEREWLFQIILHLNDFCALITSGLSVIMTASKKVVAALPENMTPDSDIHGFPWEIVICGAVLAIFVILLLVCRSYQSIKSRLYVGKEKQLASKVVELVEDKCKVLEKFSRCKKEYEELENSLKDASLLQGSTATSDIKKAYEELNTSNSMLKNEIALLEKEVREEKSKRSEQDDLMTEIQRKVEFLENEAKSIQSQVAEAKTTLKVYEISRERLKTSVQDALEENNHLQESQKQLLQEAEGWGERFSELNEQTKIFQCSKADMEDALKNKESQVKSLTECLLKMKDWSSAIGEHDDAEDSHWGNYIKCERENGEHLDDQEKRTIKKLIYAAKLNACLKSMETERNQMYSKLSDENKAKEELAERIESLEKEHSTLQSENAHFENEVQKLQQKLKVMSELYQENEMNLHRKLTVEERERLQKEEKLSKADEKIIHASEELNTYRQQAKDLEEELERTVRSYQNQIMSHEKKAHDNWLTARAAERHLNDLRKENLHNRQKLTEAEFKYDVLEKDPYALDVPVRPFGREHSPYGPSPMGRPSSETRAFLSPPTLLEGPLRLSPVLPGGGGRGSRGPGNAYDIGNERGEVNSDRLPDSHRPPSDTGSLSPPWDRDHRINPSHTGQLYNEQPLPPRRPERFYSNHPNSGRFSGPGELRSYNMQSFDKTDGQPAENNSRMDLSGNGIKDHLNDSNAVHMTDHSLVPESDPLGPGILPPSLPLLRPPLMPMDPRGAFLRRGPPFPPVPPSGAYGPCEYFPRDFAGLPRPLMPMRSPFPLRPFSQYPPSRAGFFHPLPPDNRNELPAESTPLSTASSTDHQESQET